MNNPILLQDMEYIFKQLDSTQKQTFQDSTILISGCAGFLGFYLLHFLTHYANALGIQKIIGLDNFMLHSPSWLQTLEQNNEVLTIHAFDIISDSIARIPNTNNVNLIIHAASIASPTFYRAYPIQTLDANIWGLRSLLEYYKQKPIKGFLFFSSSEIYGDPESSQIPTNEKYRGNVACIGPRACYDESKRFGETMCYLFALKYNLPITIARPFNNYGPGMSLQDKRVPADFANAILNHNPIKILSNGNPTRTFCYVADAIAGYLKILTFGKFEYFNIGMDTPEISIKQLALLYLEAGREILDYQGEIVFDTSNDKDYLTHNPNRRLPDITKAKTMLNFTPNITIQHGIERFLKFLAFEQSNTPLSTTSYAHPHSKKEL